MNKTQIENSLLGENLTLEVMRERKELGAHYALVKIGLFAMSIYAICILAQDYAFESVGESLDEAERLFELSVSERLSSEHLGEVISDLKSERMREIF